MYINLYGNKQVIVSTIYSIYGEKTDITQVVDVKKRAYKRRRSKNKLQKERNKKNDCWEREKSANLNLNRSASKTKTEFV